MKDKILLTIVIPVYNVEKYLNQCIDSILEVCGKEVEIILVNDGSTDASNIICQNYSCNYSFIKYVEQKNQGLSEARNTGIKNAKGKYILFLDSDDYIYTKNMKRLLEIIRNNRNEDFFLGRAYQFDDGKKNYELCQIDYQVFENRLPEEVFLTLDNMASFWFAAWLIVINREFLLRNQLFFKKGIYHEDELWVPSVFVASNNIGFINFGFYCYRLNRTGSIITTANIKREFDKLIIIEEFDKMNLIGTSKKLIEKRQAALLFGIILKLNCYVKDERYEKLLIKTSSYISKLKVGKYRFIYLIYRLIGLVRLSRILSK